jgi:hypothetical protein
VRLRGSTPGTLAAHVSSIAPVERRSASQHHRPGISSNPADRLKTDFPAIMLRRIGKSQALPTEADRHPFRAPTG